MFSLKSRYEGSDSSFFNSRFWPIGKYKSAMDKSFRLLFVMFFLAILIAFEIVCLGSAISSGNLSIPSSMSDLSVPISCFNKSFCKHPRLCFLNRNDRCNCVAIIFRVGFLKCLNCRSNSIIICLIRLSIIRICLETE